MKLVNPKVPEAVKGDRWTLAHLTAETGKAHAIYCAAQRAADSARAAWCDKRDILDAYRKKLENLDEKACKNG